MVIPVRLDSLKSVSLSMKVLHLIDSGGLYGAEKMVLNLMEEQIKMGDSPMLLSAGAHEDGEKAIELEARHRNLTVAQGSRVSLRALWALKDMRHLMNPVRHPLFAWQLVSHKLLRYTAFVPLITLAISTLILAPARGVYTLAFIGLVIFMALAWTGHKREGEGRPLSVIYSIPYYFMLLNIASYKATAAFLKGEKKVIWNPRKG